MIKKGDTILYANEEDMIKTSMRLGKEGIFTDWLDIKEAPPLKWRLTVVRVKEK